MCDEILRTLDTEKLEKLKHAFKDKNQVNESDFKIIVAKLLDNLRYDETDVIKLFNSIDVDRDGIITWSDFLDFTANFYRPKTVKLVELGEPEFILPPHVKRDTIVKVLLLETDTYFCYAILSKYGRVGLYGGNLDFLTSYSVLMAREDATRSDEERRRRNRWITDAVFVTDIQMLIVINSAYGMTIYDASSLKHVVVWLVLGFPFVPQSINYTYDKRCKLCLGSDYGQISIMYFQKPKDALLRRKHNDKLTVFYYRELLEEKDHVIIQNLGRLHSDAVTITEFYHNENTFISCSRDKSKSIMITEVGSKQRPYVFKMRRGANCFAISDHLKVLITGSDDGTIRIWNSVVSSKPLASLKAHKSGVVDLIIAETLNFFMSISRSAELKLWDLKEQKCLQTVLLNFPSFEEMGKCIEWGVGSIHPGPKLSRTSEERSRWERKFILISCCNYIAKIDIYFANGIERNSESTVLGPPPLQNSVLIPKTWKLCNRESEDTASCNETEITSNLDELKFILEKDILTEIGGKNDINYKIAALESRKLKMRWAVEQCAPYLALDLYDFEEISLNSELPVPNLKSKNLSEKLSKMLSDASAKSIIFSDISSSSGKSPRSSRSSLQEFE